MAADRRPAPVPSVERFTQPLGTEACEVCPVTPHRKWTHCARCHSSWSRESKTTHCVTCCRTFTTHRVCDAHLKPVGQRGCYEPASVYKRDGTRVFADPTPNVAGTPVWRLAEVDHRYADED